MSLMRTTPPSAVGADDDVLELLDRRHAALGGDVELESDLVEQRRGADQADRRLHVLRLDRLDDIVGGDVEARHAVEVEPHRIE